MAPWPMCPVAITKNNCLNLKKALPRSASVDAPAGSLLMFPGGLWHGAYRKTNPGLRVTMLGPHCLPCMMPLQDFKGRVSNEMIAASEDPDYLRSLLR